jgi:hypothetical protein
VDDLLMPVFFKMKNYDGIIGCVLIWHRGGPDCWGAGQTKKKVVVIRGISF